MTEPPSRPPATRRYSRRHLLIAAGMIGVPLAVGLATLTATLPEERAGVYAVSGAGRATFVPTAHPLGNQERPAQGLRIAADAPARPTGERSGNFLVYTPMRSARADACATAAAEIWAFHADRQTWQIATTPVRVDARQVSTNPTLCNIAWNLDTVTSRPVRGLLLFAALVVRDPVSGARAMHVVHLPRTPR